MNFILNRKIVFLMPTLILACISIFIQYNYIYPDTSIYLNLNLFENTISLYNSKLLIDYHITLKPLANIVITLIEISSIAPIMIHFIIALFSSFLFSKRRLGLTFLCIFVLIFISPVSIYWISKLGIDFIAFMLITIALSNRKSSVFLISVLALIFIRTEFFIFLPLLFAIKNIKFKYYAPISVVFNLFAYYIAAFVYNDVWIYIAQILIPSTVILILTLAINIYYEGVTSKILKLFKFSDILNLVKIFTISIVLFYIFSLLTGSTVDIQLIKIVLISPLILLINNIYLSKKSLLISLTIVGLFGFYYVFSPINLRYLLYIMPFLFLLIDFKRVNKSMLIFITVFSIFLTAVMTPFGLLKSNFWTERIQTVSSEFEYNYLAIADAYNGLLMNQNTVDLCMNNIDSLPDKSIILIDGYAKSICPKQIELIENQIGQYNIKPIKEISTSELVELDRYIAVGELTKVYFLER